MPFGPYERKSQTKHPDITQHYLGPRYHTGPSATYRRRKKWAERWTAFLDRLNYQENQLVEGVIGAQGQNRTADTGIFNPLLYRLSYLGMTAALVARKRRY